MTACYATGNVTGDYSVGGVVGLVTGSASNITACYSTGNVTATGEGGSAGGVVGSNNDGSTVTACYHATGTVSGPNATIGGVAGYSDNITTACYWGSNPATGIGYILGGIGGDATKVDGTDVTWQIAQSGMNEAIETWNDGNPNKQCNWRYAETDAETPPTLEPVNN